MKAYLATTGAIFGLIAIMHALRSISERDTLHTHPVEFFAMAGLGVVAAALALWAARLLFRKPPRGFDVA